LGAAAVDGGRVQQADSEVPVLVVVQSKKVRQKERRWSIDANSASRPERESADVRRFRRAL
jgi:hypothetical protein